MKRIGLLIVLGVVVATSPIWAAAPACRYTLSTDHVKDNKTGLTWQRATPASTYTFSSAATYCQGLSLGGFASGWRLPTRKELESIVDFGVIAPAIDAIAFPSTPTALFWTSTISNSYPVCVSFDAGRTQFADTTDSNRVRCVH